MARTVLGAEGSASSQATRWRTRTRHSHTKRTQVCKRQARTRNRQSGQTNDFRHTGASGANAMPTQLPQPAGHARAQRHTARTYGTEVQRRDLPSRKAHTKLQQQRKRSCLLYTSPSPRDAHES
eukprot:1738414-Prymnesium_polylepis.2